MAVKSRRAVWVAVAVALILVGSVIAYRVATKPWVAKAGVRTNVCSAVDMADVQRLATLLEVRGTPYLRTHELDTWGDQSIIDRCRFTTDIFSLSSYVELEVGKGPVDMSRVTPTWDEYDLGGGDSSISAYTNWETVAVVDRTHGRQAVLIARTVPETRTRQVARVLAQVVKKVNRKIPDDFRTPGDISGKKCDQVDTTRIEDVFGARIVYSRSSTAPERGVTCSFASATKRAATFSSADLPKKQSEAMRKSDSPPVYSSPNVVAYGDDLGLWVIPRPAAGVTNRKIVVAWNSILEHGSGVFDFRKRKAGDIQTELSRVGESLLLGSR